MRFFWREKEILGVKKNWGWKWNFLLGIPGFFLLEKGGFLLLKKGFGAKKGDFGVFQWIQPEDDEKIRRERGKNWDKRLKMGKLGEKVEKRERKWDK